jgi:Cu-Zn family superoxide dismutase
VIRALKFGAILAIAFTGLLISRGQARAEDVQAFAILMNANGQAIGRATFVEVGKDVRVTVDASGLRPGLHGMHIHAVGSCVPVDFASAGSHFNPANHKHGLQTSEGPHAGDFPNLVARADGTAHFSMTVGRFTLSPGATSLFDADRSAIVIHADMDDGITDPTGNSGARVACGVVTAGLAPAAAQAAVPATVAVTPPNTGNAGLRSDDDCSGLGCACCCCRD